MVVKKIILQAQKAGYGTHVFTDGLGTELELVLIGETPRHDSQREFQEWVIETLSPNALWHEQWVPKGSIASPYRKNAQRYLKEISQRYEMRIEQLGLPEEQRQAYMARFFDCLNLFDTDRFALEQDERGSARYLRQQDLAGMVSTGPYEDVLMGYQLRHAAQNREDDTPIIAVVDSARITPQSPLHKELQSSRGRNGTTAFPVCYAVINLDTALQERLLEQARYFRNDSGVKRPRKPVCE